MDNNEKNIFLIGSELRRETFPGSTSGRDYHIRNIDSSLIQYRMSYTERVKMEQDFLEVIRRCINTKDRD